MGFIMSDRPKWLQWLPRKASATARASEATPKIAENTRTTAAPSLYSIMQRTRARDVHDLEDLLDFGGILRPDEAKAVRRQLGRPEPDGK